MIDATLTIRPPPSAIIERTTYFVMMMRRQRVQAHQTFDLASCIVARMPLRAESGVVDQSMYRAELLAQLFDQRGNRPRNSRDRMALKTSEPARPGFSRRIAQVSCSLSCRAIAMTLVAGGHELDRDTETQPATATGNDDGLLHHERANLPDGATSSDGTKRTMVGTLYGANVRRQLSMISLFSRWTAVAALAGESAFTTTSATTIAPMIGFLRATHQRHLHARMPIDDGLDFFGMDLAAAHIDDAVLPSDEVVAVAAQFDQIARVDKAVRVRERVGRVAEVTCRVSRRTNSQRAVFDFQLDSRSPSRPMSDAGKPARPSRTSKPTPASVEAKAWTIVAFG